MLIEFPVGSVNEGFITDFVEGQCLFSVNKTATGFEIKEKPGVQFFNHTLLTPKTGAFNFQGSLIWRDKGRLERWDMQMKSLILMPDWAEHTEEKLLKQTDPFVKIYLLKQLIFRSSQKQMDDILAFVQENLRKDFPKSTLHLIEINPVVAARTAFMRMAFSAKKIPAIMQRDKGKFPGFKSMQRLDSTTSLAFSYFLTPLYGLFSPCLIATDVERVEGSIVFNFNEDRDCQKLFPWRPQDISSNPTYFSEGLDIKDEETRDLDYSGGNFDKLLDTYVKGIDGLFAHLLNPDNVEDGKPEKWLPRFLTISRIANETNVIETDFHNHFIRKLMSFAIADQLAELLGKTKVEKRDVFKKCFSADFYIKLIGPILRKWPYPFSSFLPNRCRDLSVSVKDGFLSGIFVDSARKGQYIEVDGNLISEDEYVGNLIRGLRNTHHGYEIFDLPFLAIHNGMIPNRLPELMKLLWLALITDPAKMLNLINW